MSISAYDNRRSYRGDGTVTPWPFPIPFTANSDLLVIRRAEDGGETRLSLATDYTVSGAGNPAGGSVVPVKPTLPGAVYCIIRDVPITQPLILQDGGPLPAATANAAFDRRTMVEQRLYEMIRGSLRLKETDTPGSGSYDAGGNQIFNAAPGTRPDSLITLAQAGTFVADAAASAAQAAASASRADGSAQAAANSAAQAHGYATRAESIAWFATAEDWGFEDQTIETSQDWGFEA